MSLMLMPLAVADLHGRHEAEAAAMERADYLLVTPAVVDRLSRCLDPAAEGRFRHDAPLPDRLVKLVLRNGPLAVLDENTQEVENLRLDRFADAPVMQFVPLSVQLGFGK